MQGFADEAELGVLKVAQAAVDDAGHGGAGAGAEVGFFDEKDVDALKGEFAEEADAVDATADDQDRDIEMFAKKREGRTHRQPEIT